jgi:hypothetical protein
MPARNPEAVRQRAIEAARLPSGQPAILSVDPVFVALNHGELPVRARSGGELAERVRRAEDYAALGARVVVELHTRKPRRQARNPHLGDHPSRRPRLPAVSRARRPRRAPPSRPRQSHELIPPT